MAQSDQSVQNATFPSVRADINDNLAALFSQSSGNSAPSVTVAFQPWVDTSSSPPVWKVRNGSNSAWITVGVLDPAGFKVGGITPIANGGTGAITAALALAALLPSQTGNAGKALVTSGSAATWGTVASGASIQVFTASGTYTPTAGKTTFLAFATGGGGGGGNAGGGTNITARGSGGGAGGTALRLFNSTEMGSSASLTIGAGGAAASAGASTIFTPAGTGLAITGIGGSAGVTDGSTGGAGGGTTNSVFNIGGGRGGGGGIITSSIGTFSGTVGAGGVSFFAGGVGGGGLGATVNSSNGTAGTAGVVFILEW